MPHLFTKVVHAGEPQPRIGGAVSMPIFQSAMYESSGETSYHDIRYIRLNNTPNALALARKLAELEGGEAALVAGSGMAAITATLLSLVRPDDHLLCQRGLYGGTHTFITKELSAFGVRHDVIDAADPASWETRLAPRTRLIYVETMGNPLLDVPDLEAVVRFARAHGIASVIDNTFATPVNFRPLEHGFDISLHSATKYLNGHSDLVAGVAIGRAALLADVKARLDHLGGALDPHAAWLLHRGIKTLALRVRQQNGSALQIASWLERQPDVTRVNYPGLASHPGHERARRLFQGFSGMMSFELKGGLPAAKTFMDRTRIPLKAPSLGGVESLLTMPALTSHAGIDADERRALGISDSLVRLSVGIEDPDDLIADFQQALGTP